MIIVRIFGGLGNQLFQYAAGRAVALNAGLPLKLDTTDFTVDPRRKYRLHLFNVLEDFASSEEIAAFLPRKGPTVRWFMSQIQRRLLPFHLRPLIFERMPAYDPALFRVKHSAYLFGYWQSDLYFQGISDTIRREFVLRPAPSEENRALLEQISNTQAVSLHVRRGDYVRDPATNRRHGALTNDYYETAIRKLSEQVTNPHFFVFSDEIEWVKENLPLPYPATYVDINGEDQEYEDLRLMSHCRYHIIANSSFSWWGAWLADYPDKIVIAPRRWFTDPNRVSASRYPEGWIVL